MAQFDVYMLAQSELVLDVQTDLLGQFESRIVVPLLPPEQAPVAHPRLNPPMLVDGQTYVMVTQFMIAIRRAELRKPIASLKDRYDAIRSALDMIFLGF